MYNRDGVVAAGGMGESSLDVSGDDWLDQDGVCGRKWETDRIGWGGHAWGATDSTGVMGAGAMTRATSAGWIPVEAGLGRTLDCTPS
jgi:hypothetical protein